MLFKIANSIIIKEHNPFPIRKPNQRTEPRTRLPPDPRKAVKTEPATRTAKTAAQRARKVAHLRVQHLRQEENEPVLGGELPKV